MLVYSISENLGAVFSDAYESVGKKMEEFIQGCTGFKISVDIIKGSMWKSLGLTWSQNKSAES